MFLAAPERSVRLPAGCAYGGWPCCATRSKACLLSVCGNAAAISEALEPVSLEDLALVHPNPAHLTRLLTDAELARDVFDLPPPETPAQAALTLERVVLPLRVQCATLIMATQRAFRDRSIVLVPRAGHHHSSPDESMGAGLFCDVPLAWLKLRASVPGGAALKALYIDVDVHHANGFALARAQLGMQDHFAMLDVYNEEIWPFSPKEPGVFHSVEHVNIPVPIRRHVRSKAYMAKLSAALERAAAELPQPDVVFYMCHLDAMEGDPLGVTDVSAPTIYKRDRMVVQWARARNAAVVIMPSAGYGASSCRVARESMARLNDEFHMWE